MLKSFRNHITNMLDWYDCIQMIQFHMHHNFLFLWKFTTKKNLTPLSVVLTFAKPTPSDPPGKTTLSQTGTGLKFKLFQVQISQFFGLRALESWSCKSSWDVLTCLELIQVGWHHEAVCWCFFLNPFRIVTVFPKHFSASVSLFCFQHFVCSHVPFTHLPLNILNLKTKKWGFQVRI